MMKSVIELSVKDNILLESRGWFVALASLRVFVVCWSSQTVVKTHAEVGSQEGLHLIKAWGF